MEEKIWESMQKVADVLHWLGKYDECNTLIMTGRLMRANKIETSDEWAIFVAKQERLLQRSQK